MRRPGRRSRRALAHGQIVVIARTKPGLAAAVRDNAAAIGLVLGVLYLFPLVLKPGMHDAYVPGTAAIEFAPDGGSPRW
jgi:hypothetical protein